MSVPARAYVILTATIGVLILQRVLFQSHSEDSVHFLCYLVSAVLTSQLKVRLPGITGTMSVNFFFILLAMIELDLQKLLAITCAATLGQMLWHAGKRPRPIQLVFNLASITIASYCAYIVYHWSFLRLFGASLPILLLAPTIGSSW
jgi:hypothetical protein